MKRFCVVLAGGLGTRLREVTGDVIPKVLVPVNGRPFLAHKLDELRLLGVTDVLLLVGQLGHLVDKYLEENSINGLRIVTAHDGPELRGTGGAIRSVLAQLPDLFWVTYGDTLVRADLARAEGQLSKRPNEGLMTVLHNRNQLQPSNCRVFDGRIAAYSKANNSSNFEWLDYGLLLLRRDHFLTLPVEGRVDLTKVVQELISHDRLLAFEVTDRFWDVGTPDALLETEQELSRRLSL